MTDKLKSKKCINVSTILYVIIVLGILFIHIYKLDSVPYGINVDEMGMGYDAFCLANFGVDRYLNSFPLYFINFTSGQSVLYGYICAFFVKLFGLSVWTMRLPAVLFALLTAHFGVKLVRLVHGESKFYILGFLFLYMVCPVFMFLYRVGLDCNLMLGMMTIFLFFICKAVETQKKIYFLISGITGGILLYSYILSYIMLPVFLLFLLMYMLYIKKITLNQFWCCFLPICILGMPLLFVQLIQIFDWETIQIGFFTLPKMYQYRGNEITLGVFAENFKNIWKVIFLYDTVGFDSSMKFGNMYYVSIPFLLIGIIHNIYLGGRAIVNKEWNVSVPLVLWFWVEIIIGCIFKEKELCLYRYNAIYIVLLFFLLDGIGVCVLILYKKRKEVAYVFGSLIVAVYTLLFASFMQYYFVEYPVEGKLNLFNHTFKEALVYLENEGLSEKKIYVGALDQTYIYFLGSNLLSPYEYSRGDITNSQELWEWANFYKNYEFNLPEEPVLNACYIVDKYSSEYCDKLRNLGFTESRQGEYYVFVSPLSSFGEEEMTDGYGWDAGIVDNTIDVMVSGSDIDGVESYVLVGWSFDSKQEKCWDDLYITINGDAYYPETTEREDIVENYSNNNILNCGFVFILPAEKVRNADHITLYGANTQDKYLQKVDVTVKRE